MEEGGFQDESCAPDADDCAGSALERHPVGHHPRIHNGQDQKGNFLFLRFFIYTTMTSFVLDRCRL